MLAAKHPRLRPVTLFLQRSCKQGSQQRHRGVLAIAAAAAAAAAAAVPAAATVVPEEVLQQIQQSNQQWLQHALSHKLQDAETGCTIVLLGTCFFAPLQEQLVAAVMQQLQQVDHVLIEQPAGSIATPDISSSVLLPYPAWLQAVVDYSSEAAAAATGSSMKSDHCQQQHHHHHQGDWVLDLQQQLASVPVPAAQVGRTIADPAETFGFYPGLDFVMQPSSCSDILQHCGFLPGLELAVAAKHALMSGAQLSCIDAPLKLQEPWVKQLLDQVDDRVFEQQMKSYNPLTDLNSNELLLPAAAAAWDRQLAHTAQQLDLEVKKKQQQQQQQQQHKDSQAKAGATQLSPAALSLYRVSKAAAAAMLTPAAAPEVMERMQRLQPLKWAHYNLRQKFMARQIREAATALADSRLQLESDSSSSSSSSSSKPAPAAHQHGLTLVAVVGRQHVHALQQMWADRGSRLWQDRMPRSFAPSVVERLSETDGSSTDDSLSGSSELSSSSGGAADVPPA